MSTQTLGARLRALRQERGLTLAALAGAAELSVSYLNDIEHDRTVPTLGKLRSIAEVLDLSVRDVLQGVPRYDRSAETR